MGILSSLPADVNRLDRAEKGEGQRFLILQWREIPAIINTKNKNAAAHGCSNTRKPAQVPIHLHNGPRAAPHGILYDIPALHARGGFCRFISVPVCMRLVLALCGVILHGVFVFHPACGDGSPVPGARAPGAAVVKTFFQAQRKGGVMRRCIGCGSPYTRTPTGKP